jgi:phosphate transport system substrate-binding protein
MLRMFPASKTRIPVDNRVPEMQTNDQSKISFGVENPEDTSYFDSVSGMLFASVRLRTLRRDLPMRDMRQSVALVLILGIVFQCAHAAEPTSIVAAGATTVQPIVQQCARKFKQSHPEVDFVVGAGGSDHGVLTTVEGKVQLGMVGRALKDAEKEKYPELHAVTIGMDGIGLVVHSSNPVRKLTKQQLQDIYSGKVANWKDVGGKDGPIALASRTKGHAQLDLFLSFCGLEVKFDDTGDKASHRVKGVGEYSAVAAKTAINNDKMLEQVVIDPSAISYLPIGFAQTKISRGAPIALLELDGIEATQDNVANGTYPLRRPLLVITKGEASGAVKEFIDYLIGEEGQQVVSSLDYTPVPKKETAQK